MKFSYITGTGSYLPSHRLSNQDMVTMLAQSGIETSHEWIIERTGIEARHFASEQESTSDLALQASLQALKAAGCAIHELDLIIVATSTPDMVFPSTATILQEKLTQYARLEQGDSKGASGGMAFDVQAVCSGFMYALSVADAMIKSGQARKALVVGAETFSRLLDFQDRTTCVLFGDGAGAVVLEAIEHDGKGPALLASALHADGQHRAILQAPARIAAGRVWGDPFVKMDGPAVFKLAVGLLGDVALEVLAKAHMQAKDIDWLVPHQANLRIMLATARKLHLEASKVVVTVDQHGNTSAASIPLALDQAVRDHRIVSGQHVLLEGVGSGFTWGATLLRM